jgi:hypothetical protein
MDDRPEPQMDPVEIPGQEAEFINGQAFDIGTVDQFALAVWGKPLERDADDKPVIPKGLVLGVRKFVTTDKLYRLVWRGRGQEWLAAEDQTKYRMRTRCLLGGAQVAGVYGAFLEEA